MFNLNSILKFTKLIVVLTLHNPSPNCKADIMVRGYKGCPKFCPSCKADCHCDICNDCHTCMHVSEKCRYNTYSCPRLVHSCNLNGVYTEAKKEAFEFARLFDSDTLTVIVGDEQRKFNIHLDAVCSVSQYFKKLISSNMKEVQEKVLTLNDEVDDANAFDMFVQYCYLKSYIVDEELYLDSLYLHARVYVLAERLGCIDLKSLALKRATELCYESCDGNLQTGEMLRNLAQTILAVYTHTYDSNTGKLPFTKKEEADEESKETVRRDGFRLLLASFAAPHLSHLRKDKIFLNVNNLCPNFAADLLLFVTSGAKMEVNNDGSLKYPSL